MRALRLIRAWLAFKIAVHWLPDRWVYGDGFMHLVWLWLLPWAGRWAFAKSIRESGMDPWGRD